MIICIDFDGVLHSYTSGRQGVDVIPDPPNEGALDWLIDLMESEEFTPVIYSSRSKDPKGVEAMKSWLCHWFVTNGMGASAAANIVEDEKSLQP